MRRTIVTGLGGTAAVHTRSDRISSGLRPVGRIVFRKEDHTDVVVAHCISGSDQVARRRQAFPTSGQRSDPGARAVDCARVGTGEIGARRRASPASKLALDVADAFGARRDDRGVVRRWGGAKQGVRESDGVELNVSDDEVLKLVSHTHGEGARADERVDERELVQVAPRVGKRGCGEA